MAVDALLHSLHEYFTLSDDVKSGCASIEELQEVKKRVAKALNDYIEFRLDSVIEQRKRRDSSQMRNVIVVPESNSAIIWSDVEKLVKDLTNAPKPINIDDLNFENFKTLDSFFVISNIIDVRIDYFWGTITDVCYFAGIDIY